MKIKKFFATTVSITLLLLLGGLASYLVLGGVQKSKDIVNQFEVAIYFTDSTSHDQVCTVEQGLLANKNVASSKIITKTQAAKEFQSALGINLGDKNPLPASIRVTLKGDVNVKNFEQEVSKIKGVEQIDYPYNIAKEVKNNLKTIWYFVLGFCVVLGAVIVILIRNCIRMDVAASSEAISQAIAQRMPIGLIRQPFTLRAFTQGAIAGAMASVFLFLATTGIATIYPFTKLPIDMSLMFVIFAVMMLSAMLLSWVFAYFAVGAQIKNR